MLTLFSTRAGFKLGASWFPRLPLHPASSRAVRTDVTPFAPTATLRLLPRCGPARASCPGVRCCAAHPWLRCKRRVERPATSRHPWLVNPAGPARFAFLLRSRTGRHFLWRRSPRCCSPVYRRSPGPTRHFPQRSAIHGFAAVPPSMPRRSPACGSPSEIHPGPPCLPARHELFQLHVLCRQPLQIA